MDWGHRKLPWWKCQCSQELVKIYFYYKHTEELFWSEHYGEQALKRCFSTVRPKQKLNTTRLDDSLKRQPRARLMFVYNEIQYWCDMDTVQPLRLVRVTYRECGEDKNQRSKRKISLSTKRKHCFEELFCCKCLEDNPQPNVKHRSDDHV